MKKNKGLIIGLAAAGAAIAGAVIFFAATKTGRETMKKWGPMGKKLADGAEDLVKTAKKKFENLKEELVAKNDEAVSQGYE